MSGGITRARLAEERKAWRKNHPHGFVARPETTSDGSVNLMVWHCLIPGVVCFPGFVITVLPNSRVYILSELISSNDLYTVPPNFFHPNVYPSGRVCLSILSEEDGWRPAISVKQVLIGIQDLLDQPNPYDPAQSDGYQIYTQQPADEYKKRVREQAMLYPSPV